MEKEGTEGIQANAATFQKLIAPVVAVLLIFGGVVVSLVLTGARIQDEAEIRRSLQIVESAFQIEGSELGRLAIGLSRSEQAVRVLGPGFDAKWLQEAMASIRGDSADFGAVLFDGTDSVIYSDGPSQTEGSLLRLREFAGKARSLPPAPADAIAGFATVDGMLYIAAASIVAPAAGEPGLPITPGVLVLLRPVNATLLGRLSQTFLIDGLRVEMPPHIVATVGMKIEPPEGGTMALITWKPAAPGSELFGYLLVPIVIASLIASLLLVAFLRTAMQAAQQLKKGAAALAESGFELEHSENKLAAIIDGVADGIIALDENGKITSANAAVTDIFGYDVEEVIGQPGDMLIVGGDSVSGNADFPQAVLRADPAVTETEYREFAGKRKDGGRFTLDTAISHITYRDAAVAIAIMRDITERKQAEETLNLLSTGMALVDRDCRLLLANRSASRLFDFGDGLALSHGRITTSRRDQVDQLRELVYRTCTGESLEGEDSSVAGVMTIERGDDIRPLSLMVAPVSLTSEGQGGSQVAAIFIRDLEVRQAVPPEVLSKLFGLTPAEARVVVELVKGKRPQEVADDLNVSLNTVRNQLKQIFSKTNTGRQSELISLVLSSAAFVSEHVLEIDEPSDPPIEAAGGARN